MPATSGRVRMPHNNRMETSGALRTTAIWKKTIGHDPYAGSNEPSSNVAPGQEQESEQAREIARQVMNVARQQNLAGGGGNRDHRGDFAQKIYLGLKHTKKNSVRDDGDCDVKSLSSVGMCVFAEADHDKNIMSSSEDEFVDIQLSEEPSFRKVNRRKRDEEPKTRNRDSKYTRASRSTDNDDDSSQSSKRRDQRRGRKRKRKNKIDRKRRRNDKYNDSVSSSSSSSASTRGDRRMNKKSRKKRNQKRRIIPHEFIGQDRSNEHMQPKRELHAAFILSNQYRGSRDGYVFQMGDQGLGYYVNTPPVVKNLDLNASVQL